MRAHLLMQNAHFLSTCTQMSFTTVFTTVFTTAFTTAFATAFATTFATA